MNGPTTLMSAVDRWETRMGKSFPGERVVYRGKDLLHGLKNLSWMQLYLYGITGRIFNENQVKLFEGMWSLSTSYPDPRLWNNRIGSLAGTVRSTGTLAISAATAVSEAGIYGGLPIIRAFNFLIRAKSKFDRGTKLQKIIEEELNSYRIISGYGRPIINTDERIMPLFDKAKSLNLADGLYTQLAFKVEEVLSRGRWRMRMNVAALAAALAADQELSEREYYLYATPSFTAGIVPCFIEASEQREGIFFPIPCERIHYNGPDRKKWEPLS